MTLENHGEPWTPADDETLRELVTAGLSYRLIGFRLKRTEEAI